MAEEVRETSGEDTNDEQNEASLKLLDIVNAKNVCDLLSDEQIAAIGRCCAEGYQTDKSSRAEWEKRMAAANELALQVTKPKSFPWPNAANVKFPLVTVAAMQYQARAYPQLIPGNPNDLVKCKVWGHDPGGQKSDIAQRVATHMSWQNMEQDTGYEPEMDKLLLVQAIAGCAFKKRLFDPVAGKQISRLVLPNNFVINYFARDLETAPRYTETFYLSSNIIHQRVLDKRFRKLPNPIQPDQTANVTDPITVAKDDRQGIRRGGEDEATPYETAEQYCYLDLDDDGYEEPYIVTFDLASGQVHRIVARFLQSDIKRMDGKIYEIKPVQVYTKYGFIPSPDGGFYDLGLGALLGPINESVNSAINQIFDAAHMATLGGGFLGRGFKSKSGAFTFQPNQWFPVDAPGDDLRKSILPLPVRDPPQIMTWLIQFLVQYAERIVSATELQVGENIGQNTPAETARTMDQNGARVYNAIYKRTWRAMREEFRQQAKLNFHFLAFDVDYNELTSGPQALIRPDDYSAYGISVRPAADPHSVSDGQLIEQAQMVVARANSSPGYNRYQAELRLLKAMKIPDIEQVFPQPMQQGPNGQMVKSNDFPPPPPDPKMIDAQVKVQAQQLKQQEFYADMQQQRAELALQAYETAARITQLQADAALKASQAKGAEVDPAIKLIYAQIEAEGMKRDHILQLLDIVTRAVGERQKLAADGGTTTSVAGGMSAPLLPGPMTVQ